MTNQKLNNDVGLLTYLLYRNIALIDEVDSQVNLGSVYETVVAEELNSHGHELFYFDSKKVGEVDYLVNDYENSRILPIEVKSGRKAFTFRAIPKLVNSNGAYKLKDGIVLSNKREITLNNNIITLPIYMCIFI